MENMPKVITLANNQYIIKIGNKLIFQSYETTIAFADISTHEVILHNDKDCYTRTTSKYLNRFLKDYCGISDRKGCKYNSLN